MKHIAIIGNGISGVTAARHIRKRNSEYKITLISSETDHFFSRTALMYIYMGHMKYEHTKPFEDHFWPKNRIDLKRGYVQTIDTDNNTLVFAGGEKMKYDDLVLAVGSKPNKFGWPGQDLPGVQGLYSYQDLETLEANTPGAKHAVIVGGGLIGVEMAEMLMSRGISVSFLVRENRFWGNVLPPEDGDMIMSHMREHHVDLRLKTELKEVIAGPDGRARAVLTNTGEEIECQIVGLTAGVSPNIAFLKEHAIETNRGILVNEYLETNIPNVYAIGDCAQFHKHPTGRRPLEQVWYTGRMMGETVAATITGDRTSYKPGIWFNSAKFFDIEYQTYGNVPGAAGEGQKSFWWEHANGRIGVKLVFDEKSHEFIGINTFGIRMRHVVFDKWLHEKRSVEHVLEYLRDANFDPEMYRQYEGEICNKFNQEFNTKVQPRKASWKRILNIA